MDLEWNDWRTRKFVSNIGLITSNGPHGQNIMAAEWTNHVSYKPSLMAVHLGFQKATVENIKESKEFGISIASQQQNVVSSVSGQSSAKNVDKIAVLKELGIAEFYDAKKINVLMVKDAAMNAECKLIKAIELGDHVMFVGEVLELSAIEEKKPLLYFGGNYRKIGEQIQKPEQDYLDKIKKTVEKNQK